MIYDEMKLPKKENIVLTSSTTPFCLHVRDLGNTKLLGTIRKISDKFIFINDEIGSLEIPLDINEKEIAALIASFFSDNYETWVKVNTIDEVQEEE